MITHAITTFCATPQRTAEARRAAPTPMIAPVIVWVVETGMPKAVAPNSMKAPPVSAQKPWCGVRRVILEPIVWTIRQPPINVPRPMASWQAIMRNPETPTQIKIVEDRLVVRGRMGVVICREVLPKAHLVATNMFVREGDAWKIAHHQSALAPPPKDRPTQPAAAPRRDRRNLH